MQQTSSAGKAPVVRKSIVAWQREFHRAEDELDDPRSLALPDFDTYLRGEWSPAGSQGLER